MKDKLCRLKLIVSDIEGDTETQGIHYISHVPENNKKIKGKKNMRESDFLGENESNAKNTELKNVSFMHKISTDEIFDKTNSLWNSNKNLCKYKSKYSENLTNNHSQNFSPNKSTNYLSKSLNKYNQNIFKNNSSSLSISKNIITAKTPELNLSKFEVPYDHSYYKTSKYIEYNIQTIFECRNKLKDLEVQEQILNNHQNEIIMYYESILTDLKRENEKLLEETKFELSREDELKGQLLLLNNKEELLRKLIKEKERESKDLDDKSKVLEEEMVKIDKGILPEEEICD